MATTLRDFTIDIWLTFKDHVDMSWSTTSYNSGVPREGSRGRGRGVRPPSECLVSFFDHYSLLKP